MGFTAAAAALQGAGMAMNASAQGSALDQINKNNAAQNALDAATFDQRYAQGNKSFADQLALEQSSGDQQRNLAQGGFDQNLALEKQGYDTGMDAQNTALDQTGTIANNAFQQRQGINQNTWNTEDQARAAYNDIVNQEHATQAGYADQARSDLGTTLDQISNPNLQAQDQADRAGIITGAVDKTPSTPMAGPGVGDLLKTAYATQAANGVQKALTQGTNAARLDAYNGAVGDRARALNNLGDQLSQIQAQNDITLAPVNDELAVPLTESAGAKNVGNAQLAETNANAKSGGDLANLIAATTQANANTQTQRGQKENSDLTNALLTDSKNYETAATQANQGYNNAVQGASNNYQSGTQRITDQTNAQTRPNDLFGNLLSGLGSVVSSIGKSSGSSFPSSWDDLWNSAPLDFISGNTEVAGLPWLSP